MEPYDDRPRRGPGMVIQITIAVAPGMPDVAGIVQALSEQLACLANEARCQEAGNEDCEERNPETSNPLIKRRRRPRPADLLDETQEPFGEETKTDLLAALHYIAPE